MKLHSLKPAEGSLKSGKRIARGQGSGKGGTSTRGHKGAQSRSGYSRKAGFEGGQMPLQRRVPKFGFRSPNRIETKPINLDTLQKICDKLNVPVFIDCAYFSVCRNLNFDLDRPCIRGVSFSMSKAFYGTERLRIGLRLSLIHI